MTELKIGMNYGRGLPLPGYGNGNQNQESWIPEMGIPQENGIGQISMFRQQFQQGGEIEKLVETPRRLISIDDEMIRGKESESESWITTMVKSTQIRNGIMGNSNRDSYTTIHQGNGIVGNGENWNQVIPINLYSQGNCSNSWTPVTPVKPNPCNKPVTQVDNENWGDLVGIYEDLLKQETLNLNDVAQDHNPMVQNNRNQNRVLSTTNRNLNPILNSTHISIPKPTHDLNQVSPSVSYFPLEDPENWDGGLLAAIVRPKKSSASVPFFNGSQNNSFHDLNQTPVSDSSIRVESNSVRPTHVGSKLGNQKSNQLPTDGFSVTYRPCYNLNSPPRSELDAASSGITGQLPFAPFTPDTRQKSTESQWVPVKNGQESHRNEEADNIYNDLSTSSAVSTTQREGLVSEEGDELGIDLNKTPNQKTPTRRKKHRPKVIREGKIKKTATPKDVKNTSLNETPVKRKYVRKNPKGNGVEISPEGVKSKRKYVRKKGVESVDQLVGQQKTRVEEATEPILETPVKSCKKQLNFDLKCEARNESQTRVDQSGFNLNDNPRDIEQERRINSILERSAMKVAQNNMYAGVTTNQESSRINGITTPMANARDHALNVLARNLIMRNSVSGQGVWRNVSNQVRPVSTNGHSQTVNFDEGRGIKRPSFEQINPRNLNAMDSLYMYQKMLLGGDNHTDRSNDLSSIIESQKRTKMQNDLSTRRPEGNPRGELTQNNGIYGNVSALQLLNSCTGKVNPSYQVNGRQFQPVIERSQRPSQGHEVNSMTAMVSWNRPPATPPKDYSRPAVVSNPATLIDKNRTAMQNSSSQRSNRSDKTMLQIRTQVHQISFTKPRGGPRKPKGVVSVEYLTYMLEGLCIYEKNEKKERNALVPYRANNAIIPFEPIKKRKPRPKVDLDPESDRLWRLLMGPEGSEANETLDKDKEKWWEDERRVFRGRADSFIARMHLVQGDRRFSRWKGSVVDSVIGVYLTQNVSDHLSSSAFMSLAAKFPIKTTNSNETRCQGGACVLVEEPIETILPINKILRQPVFNQSSYVSFESSNHIKPAANSKVILSQDSLDSSTIQTVDEIRSSSGSNSEAEDQTNGFESSRDPGPPNPVQPEKVNLFRELFSHDNSRYMRNLPKTPPGKMQNVGSTSFGSFPSNKSGITEGYHTSNLTFQQNEIPRFQVENSAHKQDSCNENCFVENATAEANSKEQNGPHKNISKGRKGNTEDEKKKAFDWDSLRRDVFLKCEKKERCKDAADSLDYEALRRARVNELSNAIRERGMNNLLADRIKDFLDRLVRDHGSIDLEWLRDVPPDKAKDYLLSIRGLGLKSVECVRLLTLHHLAFPVDTNVGRIAVRLGWVPLQPLPESLQLHLLEMYPVLESIQKYLWPRLCKLDQLTLYELHYQMITFGKVFCTKSKPNCNACPMRAECRHFASAFASARLALPGPEEKGMVPSDTPNVTHTMPPVISRPMSLPPAEINCNKDARLLCEPIIEEPTTPEPEAAELTLSDIEDHYYDDDDEIPTIKLDMNEFTMNLQKMQDSMETNGDMSKALVALNPQAASIPTPKLKNVSRLRTEHLVYELPDSHPILEGMYKREPDDPSHYLLAIWTPGETANSMQPPERGCQTQESGMLCDSTTCFSCNCIKEANSQVVRGTILMPCRTAMRGSFPLNGTYFQVNEMFADHASSLKPIDVPRSWIWNLTRRTVYFGTSVSTIFKGLTTPEIQMCFWRGFVCVRGFDQKTRSPRPLMARLHFPASKLVKNKNEEK